MTEINWENIKISGHPECEWELSGQKERRVLVAFNVSGKKRPDVREAIFNPKNKTFILRDENNNPIDIYEKVIAWAYMPEYEE